MKNGKSVGFDIAQGHLTGCELHLELVEADIKQVIQRRHDPRCLDGKVYGEGLKAYRRLNVREPRSSGVLDILHLPPTSRTFGVVARYER